MMRRIIAATAVICALSLSLGAQTVLDTHPAQDSGKDFTMKDVTVSRTGYAASFSAQWQDGGSYLFRDADGTKVSTIAGEVSGYEPAADEARSAIPRRNGNRRLRAYLRPLHCAQRVRVFDPSSAARIAPRERPPRP